MALVIYGPSGTTTPATDEQEAAILADLGAAPVADVAAAAAAAGAAQSTATSAATAAAAAQSTATSAGTAAAAAQSTATSAATAAAAAQATAAAAYVKPADGVPREDLDHTIRGQLDLAGTALRPGTLPAGTTLEAAQISDATAAGRAVLTAADQAAQRMAMGAMAATLPAMQSAFSAGTAAEQAQFQSSVSEYPALLQSQTGTGSVGIDRYPYTLFASATAPAPLTVVGGEIVHTPSAIANSAGYLQVDLGAPVTRIGAEVAWPANNAGTAATLVVPLTPWSSGVVTDAGLHITIYANGIWSNEYLAPAAGGGITRSAYAGNTTHGRFGYVGDGVFRDFEVTLDREHNRIAVRFPDGSISTHACPYLQYCGNYAIWELFEFAGGATQPAKFRKIWADTKSLSRNYRGDMDVFGPVFSGPASRAISGNQTIYCEGTNCHFLTLNGNLTGLATVGQRTGQEIELHFIQDATGGRTVSLGASFVLAGGAYVPTPGANKRDVIKFRHHLGTWYETGRVVNL